MLMLDGSLYTLLQPFLILFASSSNEKKK